MAMIHTAHRSQCCVDRVQCPLTVMLAVSDNELRAVLRMLFEEAGYAVIEASSGPIAFTLLLRSRRPLVVVLDRYLRGTDAAEKLLALAAAGPLARHRFLFLMTERLERQPQSIRQRIISQAIPVVAMPFEFEDMLHAVTLAQP